MLRAFPVVEKAYPDAVDLGDRRVWEILVGDGTCAVPSVVAVLPSINEVALTKIEER
jgi:hypothetical protein